MSGTQLFGYLLVAGSAVLLAQHWHQWRDLAQSPPADAERLYFRRRQLGRRSVASALIGVVGAAITLVNHVPKTPVALSCYLFGLVAGGVVILLIAIADWRALNQRREREQFNLVAEELRKLGNGPRAES
jgi:hypothetical protein